MEIRDGGCIEMTWYGEQFAVIGPCGNARPGELRLKSMPMGGGWVGRVARGAELVRVNNCEIIMLLECSVKLPLHRLKK